MTSIMDRKAYEFWHKKKAPRGIAYFIKDGPEGWRAITWNESHANRTARQNGSLAAKRSTRTARTVPGYIWVFHNDWDFPYGGWWLYIRTLRQDFEISRRVIFTEKIKLQAMQLYPCDVFPQLDFFREWAETFVALYPHPFPKRRLEGLAPVRCHLDAGGHLDGLSITIS